ncbi:MAG TPA: hypothetical protein VGP76_03595 [Planctomycetaceae bacterium]|nr:hypothetical protein [Planctomycetaceae bacterium]
MLASIDFFESVKDVWILWLASSATLVFLARVALVRVRGWSLRALAREENGASYTVSLVMVLPVFSLLISIIVESTLMLVVKIGTVYAAYSAARSAIVWSAAEPPDSTMPTKAAVWAMTPFASSSKQHVDAYGTLAEVGMQDALVYYGIYKLYTGGSASEEYVTSKYKFANMATHVTVNSTSRPDPSGSGQGADLAATVEYEMPLHVPGIGRLLGSQGSYPLNNFFTRKISSTVILEEELPQSDNQTLGVPYDSSQLR